MKPRTTPRWTGLVATTVLVALLAAGCGSDDQQATSSATDAPVATAQAPSDTTDPDPTDPPSTEPTATEPGPTEARVVSAEDGAAARARFQAPARVAESTSSAISLGDAAADCAVEYVPTEEEIAEANEATIGLREAFDRFGIGYTATTDEIGYLILDYSYDDVVAQSVAESYWNARYPPEPIPQEELDAIRAQNDIAAAQFDAAGIAYTRTTDDFGYESLEYDYEDPAAQEAMNAAWLIISPPEPPTPEQLTLQNEDNARLMAAFDEAGIAYELVTDELGWAWVEWDYDDPTTSERYFRILDELYPPVLIDPIEGCAAIAEPALIDPPADAPTDAPTDVSTDVPTDVPTDDSAAVESVEPAEPIAIEPLPVDNGPTPEAVAQRDAEVDAMVEGFTSAGVVHEVRGESPWQTVAFDLDNDASVPVIAGILAARG